MNENELRNALRTTLATAPAPPPMEPAPVVTAGRRAVRRRMAVIGAAAAVPIVAASVLAAGPLTGGGGGPVPAAAPASATPRPPSRPEIPAGSAKAGEPQEDATADAGPEYEKGKLLQERLLGAVPAGWSTPTGTTVDGIPLRDHQAADESGTWAYLSTVAVAKDGGTGRLLAEVHARGNRLPGDPCALARAFWGMGGECREVVTGGLRVGVVVRPGDDDRFDQWAAYRHPDGVVVFVGQSRRDANTDGGADPLTTLPLTVDGLAALAADERFHLT